MLRFTFSYIKIEKAISLIKLLTRNAVEDGRVLIRIGIAGLVRAKIKLFIVLRILHAPNRSHKIALF